MNLFVISDLHFGFGKDKPMDVFGKNWEKHFLKIKESWENRVKNDDIVVVCGDISWALKENDAISDLAFLNDLPGRKILLKGNHDLWWQSMSKFDALKRLNHFDTLEFLYNDAALLEKMNVSVCGTRGWKTPFDDDFSEADVKTWRREVIRLEASLEKALKLGGEPIVFMHYPPFNMAKREPTEMTDILEKYGIKKCYFGHIHNFGTTKYDENKNLLPVFKKDGVEYYLTACDYIEFSPQLVK